MRQAATETGATGLRIATVVGDDVRPHADALGLPPDTLFANAYLGARPIVDALDQGAQVVVTGRVADAALFCAPLAHEFGWAWDDWDHLAAGMTIGHLLECSGQVTGGNYSGRWWENPDPQRIGFPIAEVEPDGTAVITKPAGTGGMVTFDTVREQLLYEFDPARYLTPDVVADFTAPSLDDLGGDRVRVSGARGSSARPPTRAWCVPQLVTQVSFAWPTRGPTPRQRPGRRCASCVARPRTRPRHRGVARGVLRGRRLRRSDGGGRRRLGG